MREGMYALVSETNKADFEAKVSELLKKGYEPISELKVERYMWRSHPCHDTEMITRYTRDFRQVNSDYSGN